MPGAVHTVALKRRCISLLVLVAFEVSPPSSATLNTKILVKMSAFGLQPLKGIIVIIRSLSWVLLEKQYSTLLLLRWR
ncbi:hypothetical protein BGX38DRAFT_1226630 [Terfezia claveryi]|nr:hypothetical protein BGX38DRAFT_1226630 [Terfezia claveryi]